MHQVYLTYLNDAGKMKKIVMPASEGDTEIFELVDDLIAFKPSIDLNDLSDAEAFAKMKTMNMNIVAPIIAIVNVWF